MADEQKKPGAGDYFLRASNKHPAGKYRIGKHVITRQCQKFSLDEKEAVELRTEGPQRWVEVLSEKEARADAKAFAKAKKDGSELFKGVKEEV